MQEEADLYFTKEEQTLLKLIRRLPKKIIINYSIAFTGWLLEKKRVTIKEINEVIEEVKNQTR